MAKVKVKELDANGRAPITELYRTQLGKLLIGRIEDALDDPELQNEESKVDLLFTSPPFPLIRKKSYGNRTGSTYLKWLVSLAPKFRDLVRPTGSIVIEIGNTWNEGSPTMSTLPLEALLAFKEAAGLHLCQHIICHNPARLPSPAQWVTVTRSRLKDSYTHVWWLSASSTPKANNSKVLAPYSEHMKRLLRTGRYNSGKRPSGHKISERGFLVDHGGAISPNVLDLQAGESRIPSSLLKFTGTSWDAGYKNYCEQHQLPIHPAKMQSELAAFTLQFLTDPNDLVVDPFAGSNTTGAVAEQLGRRWISVESNRAFAMGSLGRFKCGVAHVD